MEVLCDIKQVQKLELEEEGESLALSDLLASFLSDCE